MMICYLFDTVLAAMQKSFPKQNLTLEDVEVTLATQEKFGHYQCNSAMSLAKRLKQNPRMIADAIVSQIEKKEFFEKIEIQGAGFINFTLSTPFLSQRLNEALQDEHLGVPFFFKNERYVVEFSAPNIAKEMHVGHLRSTIIGDSLARLFTFLGADVVRLNHVGDWGTAFGMLIAYIKENESDILSGKKQATLSDLMRLYRASKRTFDEDEAFKKRAREAVVQLQSGESETLQAWEMICHISRIAFQEIYTLLDVQLEERGESFYNPELPKIVEDLEKKGLITLSEGAKCIFHEGIKIPLMVQKSDGGYNYDTTDMAAMLHRVSVEKAKRIIVVTDAGQNLHFELVEKTARKAGYLHDGVQFDHVPFGLVLGPDGKKFRTRSGETEKLIDLLHAAVVEAKKILQTRNSGMSEKEIEELASTLGIDAVKYADLSCNRRSDYVFSYERMLRFEGNTAAFILYSYVRSLSIQRKIATVRVSELVKSEKIVLEHSAEVALGLHLLRFSEVLWAMARDLMPHYLTEYLYELAQKFNQFFRDCQVQNDPLQNRRLLLCHMVEKTLAQGLHILGLKTVDKM